MSHGHYTPSLIPLEDAPSGCAHAEASGIPCLSHQNTSEEAHDFPSIEETGKAECDVDFVFFFYQLHGRLEGESGAHSTPFSSMGVYCMSVVRPNTVRGMWSLLSMDLLCY